MSGQPLVGGARMPRLLVVGDGKLHDVFEVVEVTGALIRARTPYLFEIGEQLHVRIEHDGTVREARARVRGHVGVEDKVTELELSDETQPRRVVSG
jgi:hypothetical protein